MGDIVKSLTLTDATTSLRAIVQSVCAEGTMAIPGALTSHLTSLRARLVLSRGVELYEMGLDSVDLELDEEVQAP